MNLGWRRLSIGGIAVSAAVVLVLVLNLMSSPCGDIDRLVVESATDFAAIRDSAVDSSGGEWSTTYSIDGASSCSIVVDSETSLYLCTWEHDLSSGAAPTRYDAEIERVRSCLDGAPESVDTSVNHPDFWASTHFATADGEVIVSLKNKGALGKALVTIGASSSSNS